MISLTSLLMSLSVLFKTFTCASNITPKQPTTITIIPERTQQVFTGLGICEAFQRGTQIYGADGLSPHNTSRVLDLLFSQTNGAGLTILRNGIGSSLTNPYDLMKSIEPISPGSPSSTPKYSWQGTVKPGFEPDNGQLQLTKDAIAKGVKTTYADAWSAPGFMKNNGNDSYGGYLCGVEGIECESGDWRQAYANYHARYLRFYKEEGVNVDFVGFLNKPDLNVSYASMLSDGQQAADFLKVLSPTLKASGLKTQVACCDASGWEQQRSVLTGIQAAGAESTLGIVTAHGYSTAPTTPFRTSKPVWQTEWADLEGSQMYAWYHDGSTGEGVPWANHIQQAFATSNVSAFLGWIGAGYTTTNSALILLDDDTVNVSKRLWAYAQWSRTVQPGARKVDTAIKGQGNIAATAFRNPDGSFAIQVINNGGGIVEIRLDGLLKSLGREILVKTFLTDNESDLRLGTLRVRSGSVIPATIPAFSMASFVVPNR